MVTEEEEEYKGRIDNNSSSGSNDAVRMAPLLLLYHLLDRDKKTAKWKAPPHPPVLPAKASWKRKRCHVVLTNYNEICIGK